MSDPDPHRHALGPALLIAALGVVYGDIGASPIYTMNILFGRSGFPTSAPSCAGGPDSTP